MSIFFESNKNNNIEILKRELLQAINVAKNNPANMRNFVQMVGLIMNRTTAQAVNDLHIDYVTSILLHSEEKTMIGTGEGKSLAAMLLVASQALLNDYHDTFVTNQSVMQRNLEDFKSFFDNLGLKAELLNTTNALILTVAPAEEPLHRQVQHYGRSGRI